MEPAPTRRGTSTSHCCSVSWASTATRRDGTRRPCPARRRALRRTAWRAGAGCAGGARCHPRARPAPRAMRLGVGARWSTVRSCRATWSCRTGPSRRRRRERRRRRHRRWGFVDFQVNGFAGVDFQRATTRPTGKRARRCCPPASPPSSRPSSPRRGRPRGRRARGADRRLWPALIGADLEGPFLSPVRLGAHDADSLRAPDLALLRRLLEAGPVSQMTLAPEEPGALELVDELVARRVTVSCGHSDAVAVQANVAFDRARARSRTVQRYAPETPREPGVAMAALARADISVQVIADGHHLANETVLVAWRAPVGAARWSATRWPRRAWRWASTRWARRR